MESVRIGLTLLCLAAVGAVLVTLLVSVVQHRGNARHGGHFHKRLAVEVGWTLAPMAIVVALLFQVFSFAFLA